MATGCGAGAGRRETISLSVKTANAGTLRYISCEHVVNARAFEAAERAIIEGTAGF